MIGRLLAGLGLAVLLVAGGAAPAHAAVKYSDFRWTTPDVFVRSGDEWHSVSTGGYSNPYSRWIAYPSHGWSYCTKYGDEVGTWKLPGGNSFFYGEWQAYITSHGTNTYAVYSEGYSDPAINQYATHGWTSLVTNGLCCGRCTLSDAESPVHFVSGHRTDWDAVRFYY